MGTRGAITQGTAASREDVAKLEQRLTAGNESLNQALVRLQDRRKLVQQIGAIAERHLIEVALQRTGGNLALAADLLNVSPEDLSGRMSHGGLDGPTGSNETGNGGTPPTLN